MKGSRHPIRDEAGSPAPMTRNNGRIVYRKAFLLECSKSPASLKKPSQFPIPELECTNLVKKSTPYVCPKRKESLKNNGKEESISLRPQSGNFSSGCSPASSLVYTNSRYIPELDLERDIHSRGIASRFMNVNREDRPRASVSEQETRLQDVRRGNPRRPFTHSQQPWNGSTDEHSRQFSGFNKPRDKDFNRHSRHAERGYVEEEEPEWFVDGPTSQHETIELTGFQDDSPKDRQEGRNSPLAQPKNESKSTTTERFPKDPSIVHAQKAPSYPEMNHTLESILQMNNAPRLESGESVKPRGLSRFAELFKKNSEREATESQLRSEKTDSYASSVPTLPRLFPRPSTAETGQSKTKQMVEMGNALRDILIKPVKVEDGCKPEDFNAFKKLLDQIIEKGKEKTELKNEPRPNLLSFFPQSQESTNPPQTHHPNFTTPILNQHPMPSVQQVHQNYLFQAHLHGINPANQYNGAQVLDPRMFVPPFGDAIHIVGAPPGRASPAIFNNDLFRGTELSSIPNQAYQGQGDGRQSRQLPPPQYIMNHRQEYGPRGLNHPQAQALNGPHPILPPIIQLGHAHNPNQQVPNPSVKVIPQEQFPIEPMTADQIRDSIPPQLFGILMSMQLRPEVYLRTDLKDLLNAVKYGEVGMKELLQKMEGDDRGVALGIFKLVVHGGVPILKTALTPQQQQQYCRSQNFSMRTNGPHITHGPGLNEAPRERHVPTPEEINHIRSCYQNTIHGRKEPTPYKQDMANGRGMGMDQGHNRTGFNPAALPFTPTSVMRKMTGERKHTDPGMECQGTKQHGISKTNPKGPHGGQK